jgi:predicted Fe-Mo cluster-binding NifX family protein
MARTIVFPTDENSGLSAKRGAHFGRARFYTVITLDDNNEIQSVQSLPNPGHSESGCGGAVTNIRDLGADALVVSGIGGSPLKGFLQQNINVFYDNVSQTVHASLAALGAGKLVAMQPDMSCSHHDH